MIHFIIGLITGSFIGIIVMCLCSVVDDIDNLDLSVDEPDEEQEEMDWDV